MKLSEFVKKIEEIMPLSTQEDWDNSGLLVSGQKDKEITKIALALDATPENVAKAKEMGSELLLSHHPIIYSPLKNICGGSLVNDTIISALKNDIAIYSCHTPFDSAARGVNFGFATLMGLENITPLAPCNNKAYGLGVWGELPEALDSKGLALILKEKCHQKNFVFYGFDELKTNRRVKKIAIVGGGAASMWGFAKSVNANCYITADLTYHYREAALYEGLAIVGADHGEMEGATIPFLKQLAEEATGLPVEQIENNGTDFSYGLELYKLASKTKDTPLKDDPLMKLLSNGVSIKTRF
ncbi:MAG: Nif3-like dinuclear metal center hexameric protein [Synergistaceae bacterium]|nr:Nif3-like dinuclear metal center hexameric protein [Synergistaceae bacterium]